MRSPNTILTKAQGNTRFDGLQIAPGLTNVQIMRCTFQGRFTNAISVGPGVTNSQITNNNIDQATTGIKEAFNAQSNSYSGNTIKRTAIGMQLEGSQGSVSSSTITQNNALCSLGTTINMFPAQPLPVYCAIPQSGQNYRIINNNILNNNKGITTYSTNNTIKQNIQTGRTFGYS